jgi:hypothetical protein
MITTRLAAAVMPGPKSQRGDDRERVLIRAWLRRQQQGIRNKIRREGGVCEDEVPHRWMALHMLLRNPQARWLRNWYAGSRAIDLKNGRI